MSLRVAHLIDLQNQIPRVPEHDEQNAKQDADQDVAPKGFETQAKSLDDDISASQGDIALSSTQKDVPAIERLQGDDRRVDGHDGTQDVSEEIEEIDAWHGNAISEGAIGRANLRIPKAEPVGLRPTAKYF
jgi:hypothetical protein